MAAKQKQAKSHDVVVHTRRAAKKVRKAIVAAFTPPQDSGVGEAQVASPISEAAILDALAAIARRAENLVEHGAASDPNFDARIRARLSTPGLREWIKDRLLG